MKSTLGWLVVAGGLSASAAMASDFDGSKKLICAPVQAMDCADGVECVSGSPQALGAPAFLRIDFDRKEVTGTERTSPVMHLEKTPGQLLLQGVELGLGWTIAINSANGRMHATMAGHEGAIILSGSCTTL